MDFDRWRSLKRKGTLTRGRPLRSPRMVSDNGETRGYWATAPWARPDYRSERYMDAPHSTYYKWDTSGPETQFRGQAPGLNNPMVREVILENATSEANIAKLIEIFGVATVERVIREDVKSGEFHSESDIRYMHDDDANISALDELRRRRTAGQEYEMPAYERRYSDWKR